MKKTLECLRGLWNLPETLWAKQGARWKRYLCKTGAIVGGLVRLPIKMAIIPVYAVYGVVNWVYTLFTDTEKAGLQFEVAGEAIVELLTEICMPHMSTEKIISLVYIGLAAWPITTFIFHLPGVGVPLIAATVYSFSCLIRSFGAWKPFQTKLMNLPYLVEKRREMREMKSAASMGAELSYMAEQAKRAQRYLDPEQMLRDSQTISLTAAVGDVVNRIVADGMEKIRKMEGEAKIRIAEATRIKYEGLTSPDQGLLA